MAELTPSSHSSEVLREITTVTEKIDAETCFLYLRRNLLAQAIKELYFTELESVVLPEESSAFEVDLFAGT